MKKSLIIFGDTDTAQLAHLYFSKYSDYVVIAFTLDAAYIKNSHFCNLPLVPFEDIVKNYPPEENELFIALGYSKMNNLRKEKYLQSKEKGYRLASFISPFATVLNDNHIGENCFIFENNTIQPFVTIGNNVTLWSGNHIGHHSVIKDHSFIASHVVISGHVEIGEQCFIGVNATLRDHIKVGDKCIIGAGTLLLNDAEANGVYIGHKTIRTEIESHQLKTI